MEVVRVLREWHSHWRKLYLVRDQEKIDSVGNRMRQLMQLRKQLLSSTCTTDMARDLKSKIVALIDWGNRLLNLDLVPRVEFNPVDPESMSPIELLDIHVKATHSEAKVSVFRVVNDLF